MSDPNYSTPFYDMQVPTTGQWNLAFNNLQGNLGYTPLNIAGANMNSVNLISYSNSFNNTNGWGAINSTITQASSSIISPGGTADAWQWQRSSTSPAYLVQTLSQAPSIGITYTMSLFAKATGTSASFVALRMQGGGGLNSKADAVFNLLTGVISIPGQVTTGSFTAVVANIQSISGGWYRVSLTATAQFSNTIEFLFSGNSNNIILDGTDSVSNTTIIVYGAQLEQNNIATTYAQGPPIKLVTSASTATIAGFNLGVGVNPSSSNNGDLWATSTGLFVELGGTIAQLAGGTSASPGNIASLTGNNTFVGTNIFTGPVTATQTVSLVNPNFTPPGGRLTLTSGVPVLINSVNNAQTLYYAPYNGCYLPIFAPSSGFISYQFTSSSTDTVGLSLNLNGSSTWPANSLFDVFSVVSGISPFLVTGPAWTNSTTRSASLSYQGGFLVNGSRMTVATGSATSLSVAANQATYLGTIHTNTGTAGSLTFNFGGAASGGSAATFGVWNYYNRIVTSAVVTDTNPEYQYRDTLYLGPADQSLTNRVTFVQGIPEDCASMSYYNSIITNNGVNNAIGFDLDGTGAFYSNGGFFVQATPESSLTFFGQVPPQTGLHFIQAMETTNSGNLATIFNNAYTIPALGNSAAATLTFNLLM